MAENKINDANEALVELSDGQSGGSNEFLVGVLCQLLGTVFILIGIIFWFRYRDNVMYQGLAVLGMVVGPTLFLVGLRYVLIGIVQQMILAPVSRMYLQSQERHQVVLETLKSINERMLLSEMAKRIAYRSEDLDALRTAIKEDIKTQRFDAAIALLTEMGTTYGYKEEAEVLREEITKARTIEFEQKIVQAFDTFETFLAQAEWDRAAAEANKIKRLYPDHLKTRDLGKRILEAKEQHKRDLERAFLQAAERDEVEKAEALLKELDKYLSPQEAEPFRETARAVFGKKKQNLGVQFKLAANDKEYAQAIRVGQQIIREFPNSKMADEVRGMMDKLRELAGKEKSVAPQ